MKKTILFGKCMYLANKDDPNIKELIAIKGCPPGAKEILHAFRQAGIEMNPKILDNLANYPGLTMEKYAGRPEFDESFFNVI
jgi:coenzyme F420-reducing hydrogenase gamma subunit